jgi:hypothetical protein
MNRMRLSIQTPGIGREEDQSCTRFPQPRVDRSFGMVGPVA